MAEQIITLTTTGSNSNFIIDDLDGLNVIHPRTFELQEMFPTDSLMVSLDLQTVIDTGWATVTNNYGLVTDVSEIISPPSRDSWQIIAGRNATNLTNQYYRSNYGVRHDQTPHPIGVDCTLDVITCTNGDPTAEWNVGIEKSTTVDGAYTEIWSDTVTSGGSEFVLNSSAYDLDLGDFIRLYQTVILGVNRADRPRMVVKFRNR